MGPLSLTLPVSAFLYLLPSAPNIASNLGKIATTEQSNGVIGNIDLPKEAYKINGKVEPEKSFSNGGSIVYPLEIIKPMISSDATKLNVAFQAKVNSKKYPQPANQDESSEKLSDELKELSMEKHLLKSLKGVPKHKDTNVNDHLSISDIINALKEQFPDVNTPLESRNADKKHNSDKPIEKRKKNDVKLDRRSIDGSSLTQKPPGKDCVKLPDEFNLEHNMGNMYPNEGTIQNGQNIETNQINNEEYKNLETNGYKQQTEAASEAMVASEASDGSVNYEDFYSKSADNLGLGLTLIGKKHIIDNKRGNRLNGKFTRQH
ncbi:uncharacterized protein LOC114936821 [Nylanderia fulva]|uniref:uncharacterized protein LOC114936821 n=1 Tax=Nylanderia fulva TaxID=613905 RepID=UPI0010FB2DCA|nr:uncharacterized protein LOC114936821 [Nylanderia fulva]